MNIKAFVPIYSATLLLSAFLLFAIQPLFGKMVLPLLGGAPAEVTLTDNFAMLPTSAVSGFYFGHPESSYFGVATIGEAVRALPQFAGARMP